MKYLRHQLAGIKSFLFSRGKTPDIPLKTMPKLSEFIWGLQRQCMTVIAARPSEGKSSLAAQLAYDVSMQGFTCLFLSLETTEDKMGARLFCLHNRYNNTKAFRGGLIDNPEEWDRFEREVANMPLIINDMIGKSWEDIDMLIESTQLKPDVVIVDYIQTIANKDGQNKKETIDEYIRHFRELSIRHNFAGVICSQMNRGQAEEKNPQPQMHHMKGTGFLEEHADVCIMLSWPYKNLKQTEGKIHTEEQFHKFYLYVAKNKDGQTGLQKLKYIPDNYRFEDWVDPPKVVADGKRTVKQEDINWMD